MDRMLVVVFEDEAKAYEARRALRHLDDHGQVAVFAAAVLAKKPDGTVFVTAGDDVGIAGGLLGTALGSLIGLVGGPAGMAIGAAAGLTLGAACDLDRARIGADFIEDVTKQLATGKAAVVAEIEEDWTAPVDNAMEALGGSVLRRAVSAVRQDVDHEEIAAMKADLAQMKAEFAQSRADRKAKLVAKINHLEARVQGRMQKAKERREAAEREEQAKADALRAKAEAAKASLS
jgi:uncharacterized membrane protein